MNKIKNNIKSEYTICPNALLNDKNLSRDARFLFIWMASKPDDWNFYHKATAKNLGCKENTLRKYINELLNSGWISRKRLRQKDAKFAHYVYTLHSEPVPHFTTLDKNHTGKNEYLYKKDLKQSKNFYHSVSERAKNFYNLYFREEKYQEAWTKILEKI